LASAGAAEGGAEAGLGFGRGRFWPAAIVDIHRMAKMIIARFLKLKAWRRIIQYSCETIVNWEWAMGNG